MKKKIVFLTGTRADYGKVKSLMKKVADHPKFELHIFVTGMHLLSKYGETYKEIVKDGFSNIFKFVNQSEQQTMDLALSRTIEGFSKYVSKLKPDMIVVHGDRVEALAGATVGALNNIKVAHIEGGEVSGTIDESIRHAITKFAHIHLVANEEAKKRVLQLGERKESIYIIGSPDIDIMFSKNLPSIERAKERYSIPFKDYAILLYHPVTTELNKIKREVKNIVDALIESEQNYVVIFPNNDEGNQIILDEYERFKHNPRFRVFPSIRFEYFLTLLKHCQFMIGNSSAGVRETSVYGIPAIDIGNRQMGRYGDRSNHIIHLSNSVPIEIINAIRKAPHMKVESSSPFGEGNSDNKFMQILEYKGLWLDSFQKNFVTLETVG